MPLTRPFVFGTFLASSGALWASGGCTANIAPPIDVADGGQTTTEQSADPTKPNNAAGDDAGASISSDAGSTKPTAGDPVPVQFGQCAAFAACGGDLIGEWVVTGGCVGAEALEAGKKSCPGLTLSNVDVKAAGRVKVSASNFERNVSTSLSAKVSIPKSCGLFGVLPCNAVESGLKSGQIGGLPPLDSVTCSSTATGCDCDVATVLRNDVNGSYSTSGGTLTLTNPAATLDYCVTGNALQLRETTSTSSASFPIVFQLSK